MKRKLGVMKAGLVALLILCTGAVRAASGQIVFFSERTGNGEIWKMNANGSAQVNLTNSPSTLDRMPAFKPGGTTIVWSRSNPGSGDIWMMNADGTNSTRVTNGGPDDLMPDFHPTNNTIAYSAPGGSDYDIFVTTPDGATTTRLVNNDLGDYGAAWNAAGTKLLFHTFPDYSTADIFVINADGTGQQRLTTGGGHDENGDWSPDGSKIVFATQRTGNNEIYVMNSDGANPTRLTTDAATDNEPCFSPDGTQIAFASTRSGRSEIWVMNADGTNPTQLTTEGGSSPDWATDGVAPPGLPQISVLDANVVEGNAGNSALRFVVRLNSASTQTVTVKYTTVDDTATAGSDYQSTSGLLTFAPGDIEEEIGVVVIGDSVPELGERLSLVLSGASNGTIGDNEASGLIFNDDSSISGGGQIVFTSQRTGNNEIWKMNAAGNDQTNLTNSPTNDQMATFKPDGTTIVWSRSQPGSGDIWMMNPDGSNQARVTNGGPDDLMPDFHPTNNTIAYSAFGGSDYDVFITTPDGATITRIVNNSLGDYYPRWSPNGQKLLFYTFPNGLAQVYVCNANGTNQQRLTFGSTRSEQANWSPDGSKIVFATDRTGNYEIYVMNPDGSNQTRLTTNSASDREPCFSPDGNKIAWTSDRSGRSEIWVMNVDGTNPTQLTTLGGSSPDWGADGAAPPASPQLSVADASVIEGNAGNSELRFVVRLSTASTRTVTVNYSTQNETAIEGSDYQNTLSSVSFVPGEIEKTITVFVSGDNVVEPNETLSLKLTAPINATLLDDTAQGTIINDDRLPVAANDNATTDEDTLVNIDVLGNDSDADGDALRVANVTVSTETHGTVSINANGSLQYIPAANFNGTAVFDYSTTDDRHGTGTARVTITVRAVNDAPQARGESFGTDEDVILNVAAPGLLQNDTDIEGNPLRAIIVNPPTRGTLTLQTDGSFIYAPHANFHGEDAWNYKVNDGSADSNVATASVTVNAVNDAPIAISDRAATSEETPVTIAVLTNDSDVDGNALRIGEVSTPAHGQVALNANGTITYTPARDFFGNDIFTYRVLDDRGGATVGTVSVEVSDVAEAFLSLRVVPSTFNEAAGATAAIGVLTVSRPLPESLRVQLVSSDLTAATVASSVTIGAGQTEIAFPIAAVDDKRVDGSQPVTITASAETMEAVSAALMVADNDVAPQIEWTSPRDKSLVTQLNTLSGRVSASSALRVGVQLQRRSDGKYFGGRTWGTAPVPLAAVVEGNVWRVPTNLLPNGANLRDGGYNFSATATDEGDQSAFAAIGIHIDRTSPVVTIAAPVARASVLTLPYIAGRAVDPPGGSGTIRVDIFLRRSQDGRYWTGRNWSVIAIALPARVNGNSWVKREALPTGANLRPGAYALTAVAYDRARNRASAASGFTVVPSRPVLPEGTRQTQSVEATSRVVLSSLTAHAATSQIQITWSGALNGIVASDASRYMVEINGRMTSVEMATYDAGRAQLLLHLPPDSFDVDDIVVIRWDGLRDSENRLLLEGKQQCKAG